MGRGKIGDTKRVTIRTKGSSRRSKPARNNTRKNNKKIASKPPILTRGYRASGKNIKTREKTKDITTRGYEKKKKEEKKIVLSPSQNIEVSDERLEQRKRRFETQPSPNKKMKKQTNTQQSSTFTTRRGAPGKAILGTKPKLAKVSKKNSVVVTNKKPVNSSKTKEVVKKMTQAPKIAPVKKKKNVTSGRQIIKLKRQMVEESPSEEEEEEESSSTEEESDSESEHRLGPRLHINTSTGALILMRNIPKDVSGRELLIELFHDIAGIEQISVHTDEDGNSTGMADIAFSSASEARECIKSCRNIIYRNHEIYLTLMGSNLMSSQPRKQVIGQRIKKKKRKKKKKLKSKAPIITERVMEETPEEEELAEPETIPEEPETVSEEPENYENKPSRHLRIASPTCVAPDTRPWNWGSKIRRGINYDQDYVPPDWGEEQEDEVYYHVTMKQPLDLEQILQTQL